MSSLSDRATLAIGAAAGAAVFGAFLAGWIRTNMSGIEARSSRFGEQVAEEAVKAYLSDRVGLTPERLADIRRLTAALSPGSVR